MLAIDGAFGLALLALWIYCVIDVITTDESLVRNLPKMLWLVIVLFLPDIGSIIWLVAGRPLRASFHIGDTGYRPPPGAGAGAGATRPRRPLGIEDRPDFGVDLDSLSPIVREREEQAQLRLREEQLRRREEELAQREREAVLKRREDDLLRREKELRDGGAAPGDEPPSEAGGSKLEG